MIWWVTLEVLGMFSGLEHRGGPAQPGVKTRWPGIKCFFFILAPSCVIVGTHPYVLSRGCGIASSCASYWYEAFYFYIMSLQMIIMLFLGLKTFQNENDAACAWLDTTHPLNLELTSWITSCSSKIMIQNIYTTVTMRHCVKSRYPHFLRFRTISHVTDIERKQI